MPPIGKHDVNDCERCWSGLTGQRHSTRPRKSRGRGPGLSVLPSKTRADCSFLVPVLASSLAETNRIVKCGFRQTYNGDRTAQPSGDRSVHGARDNLQEKAPIPGGRIGALKAWSRWGQNSWPVKAKWRRIVVRSASEKEKDPTGIPGRILFAYAVKSSIARCAEHNSRRRRRRSPRAQPKATRQALSVSSVTPCRPTCSDRRLFPEEQAERAGRSTA